MKAAGVDKSLVDDANKRVKAYELKMGMFINETGRKRRKNREEIIRKGGDRV